MRVGIVGAGFTGLTAALRLVQNGHEVVVFDRELKPGGLAVGFKDDKWGWSLERHYHHIFTSDTEIQDMAGQVGEKFFFVKPKTSTFIKGRVWQVDSPINLLKFGAMSFPSRIKTGLGMAFLKVTTDWKSLEQTTSVEWLKKLDPEAFKILWEPLLKGKFGGLYDKINAAWFWARIKKRSMKLGYFEGGFDQLALKMEKAAKKAGVAFRYGVMVKGLMMDDGRWRVDFEDGSLRADKFDKVVVTGPSWMLAKIAPQLPEDYKNKLFSFKGLGAVNLVLALKEKFLVDGTYWLNINDTGYPFLAVVEHTNFVSSKHYGNDRIVYVGNYLASDHEFFKLSEDELVTRFMPFLQKINPEFNKKWIRKAWVFKAPFAQPVVGVNYSKLVLPFETPLQGLFWGSIQQVYPWDRGTNYAVEMGEKLAEIMTNDPKNFRK